MARALDITDQRFGKLVAKYPVRSSSDGVVWFCQCDCGNTSEVSVGKLRSGNTKSCGCKKLDAYRKLGELNKSHGCAHNRLYGVWAAMKDRCRNPNNKRYESYGGRGITYCPEWEDFATFQKWAVETGYDENAEFGNCTLDRINSDGNYEPSNCRWADTYVQANNHSDSKRYDAFGESHTLGEWAKIRGINYQTLSSRIHRDKMSIEMALTFRKIE